MKRILVPQFFLNQLAKRPNGDVELRKLLKQGEELRDHHKRIYEKQEAEFDKLLSRIRIALGEVKA